MNVTSTRLLPQHRSLGSAAKGRSALDDRTPGDSFTFSSGEKTGVVGLGLASGGLGVGLPASLAMGSAKAFFSGAPLAGVGLAAASLATGATLGTACLLAATMSTDGGDTTGFNAYMAGAALTTAAAGFAIF